MLLTIVFRMLIKWRSFNRAKSGTIQFQSIIRGHNIRRMLASVKVQTHYRMYIRQKKFVVLKSAILALQCATRFRAAKKIFTELMKEQKDVGKLKQNNEKLKQEMGSLRAMLSAQAKEGAASETHNREIAEKQKRIIELERRVAEIERELEAAKKMVDKLESDLVLQKETAAKEIEQTKQNRHRRNNTANESPSQSNRKIASAPEGIPADYVSPEVLAEHRSRVATLEEELDYERKLRHQTDGEIIKLRAASNGVKLNDEDVSALLAPQLSSLRSGTVSEESSYADGDTPAKVRYVTADRLLLPVIFHRLASIVDFHCLVSVLDGNCLLLPSNFAVFFHWHWCICSLLAGGLECFADLYSRFQGSAVFMSLSATFESLSSRVCFVSRNNVLEYHLP
jgi:myosin heavy subunit